MWWSWECGRQATGLGAADHISLPGLTWRPLQEGAPITWTPEIALPFRGNEGGKEHALRGPTGASVSAAQAGQGLGNWRFRNSTVSVCQANHLL